MPPTSTWPSAPTFQKRILNAGARPTPMHSSIIISRTVIQMRRFEPNAPLNMVTYTFRGLSLVMK